MRRKSSWKGREGKVRITLSKQIFRHFLTAIKDIDKKMRQRRTIKHYISTDVELLESTQAKQLQSDKSQI